MSYFTAAVMLSGNRLHGRIPAELGLVSNLLSLDATNNSFSCSGTSPGSNANHACAEGQLLPCFLQLGQVMVPRADGSNVECPVVLRKAYNQAVQDCSGNSVTQLGYQVEYHAKVDVTQHWALDPGYYQYSGCKCFKGYNAVWAQERTLLTCVPDTHSLPAWVPPIAVAISVTGFMLLAGVGLLVWLRVTVQLRQKWQREKELMRNRLKGVPNGGPACIVVTDVESYSEFMQHHAAIMTQAMGIHNAILRKAVAAQAGYVIEQEGDSWSVAFHRPVDAVAFCLQVQQALQRSPWPAELAGPVGAKPSACGSTVLISNDFSAAVAEVSIKQAPASRPASHNKAPTASGCATRSLVGQAAGSKAASVTQLQTLHRQLSDVSAEMSEKATIITQATQNTWLSDSVAWVGQGKGAANTKAGGGAVRGIKVRMGVASGWVPMNSDIRRSALFELAKAVSDMAHGGQVLIESATAAAVREWLTDLGAVDHKGYNEKLLWKNHKAVMTKRARTGFGCLPSCFSSAVVFAAHDRDAILLDMGQFWVSSLASTLRAAAAADDQHHGGQEGVVVGSRECSNAGATSTFHNLLGLPSFDASVAVAAAAAVDLAEGGAAAGCTSLGLHCMTARPLHAICKLWRGDLKLPQHTKVIAKGYFDAPGTVVADLSPAAFLDVERPLLPPVTIVFAAVEGGNALVRKKEHVAAAVYTVLGKMMQALLSSLPDGYLCGEQEAVLKYLLAFKEPARAAEWCLMMQELLQHVPWPEEVLEGFASIATVSGGDGRASCLTAGVRGRPKLKMGLAEGVPNEIAPDYLGHANYFGNSVNLAARIVSAAAHPGQIVMSLETAQTVFSAWRYEAELPGAAKTALSAEQQPLLSLSGGAGAAAAPEVFLSTAALANPADISVQLHGPEQAIIHNGIASASTSGSYQLLHPEGQSTAVLPTSTNRSEAGLLHLQPVVCQLLDSEGAAQGTPRMPAALLSNCTSHTTLASLCGAELSRTSSKMACVSHVGTYAFKGCGALDMVCLTSDGMLLNTQSHTPDRASKGALIMASSGPVVGLQDCPVALPNMLEKFQQAWANMAQITREPAAPASTSLLANQVAS